MQVIEHDFSEFLPIYNPRNLPALTDKAISAGKTLGGKMVGKSNTQISLTTIFLIITLLVIAFLVLRHVLNKTNNPSKNIINQKVNEYGKNSGHNFTQK